MSGERQADYRKLPIAVIIKDYMKFYISPYMKNHITTLCEKVHNIPPPMIGGGISVFIRFIT